jgi:regulator of RNase E activity RraA
MNTLFKNIFGSQHLEEFCSGVFSDGLDKLGLRHRVVSGFCLNRSSLRLFGRVRTLVLETVETNDERIARGLGFLDSLNPDDVLLVKGSHDYAYFGELMSRLAMEKGLGGAVIDGLTRDSYYTQTISFPIFARGYSARDIKGRGRVADLDVPVSVNGVTVTPGDFVFGDADCLVFLPRECCVRLAAETSELVKEEARIKMLIKQGMSISEMLKSVKAF